jgi:DNA-binding MarR family transcriptional regulator
MPVYHRSVGRYISVLNRHAQSYISDKLKNYNIGSGQYIFLTALYQRDGISQEELSRSLLIDKANTARAISKLEAHGYVVRKQNAKDKRAYHVFLTNKAKELKPKLFDALASMTNIFLSDIGEQEKDTLFMLLDRMTLNIKRYTENKTTVE